MTLLKHADLYIKHMNSQQNSEILSEEQNATEGPCTVRG